MTKNQKMTIDTESRHITPAGGSVFADLGFDKSTADTMQAESCAQMAAQLANIGARVPRKISGKHRSRRLRKKLRVGEFQELGFSFEATLRNPLTSQEEMTLLDALLSELIEPRALAFGGRANGGFVTCYRRGPATVDDQTAVRAWLEQRPEVASVAIGQLMDAWHIVENDEAA